MAPTVVNAAVKGAIFAANLYEKLGFKVIPDGKEDRHDIIQAVEFHDPEKLIAFCEGIQKASTDRQSCNTNPMGICQDMIAR